MDTQPATMTEIHIQETLTNFERQVLTPLRQRFVGKSEIIDLIAVTAIAQENLLLLGPPGTAKSDLIATFAAHLQGQYFQYLLTKFTEPNEIFGPIDLNKLREGIVITNTEAMLPDAEFAFLDEVFNANSAILNSLLTILNERTFRRGRQRQSLKLFAVFGASNALPEDESLRALFDRFLLRVRSQNVEPTQLHALFELGWTLERTRLTGESYNGGANASDFTTAQLRQLSRAATMIDLNPIREPYLQLITKIRAAGIEVTDRRLVKLLRAVAAAVLLRGQAVATAADLWVLRYIWSDEDQAQVLEEIVQQMLDEYLSANPDEPVHKLARPFNPYGLDELLIELDTLRQQAAPDKINSVLDADLLLEQLDTLLRKLEWLQPQPDQQTRLREALDQTRILASNVEAITRNQI
ncbi:MAG: AAA family ATPase [Acidobacteriota bacterium]